MIWMICGFNNMCAGALYWSIQQLLSMQKWEVPLFLWLGKEANHLSWRLVWMLTYSAKIVEYLNATSLHSFHEEGVQDESLGYATRLLSFLFSPKFLQCSNLLVQLQQVPVVVASICPYRSTVISAGTFTCVFSITMSVVVLLMYDLTILGVAILYNTSNELCLKLITRFCLKLIWCFFNYLHMYTA
ncbi:hypothetical protein ACJX0J_041774 [Zea mays]